jgi:thymidylate synthase
MNSEEQQYLSLVKNVVDNGSWKEGRNGKTKSIFGNMMRFSLKDGKIPILTTKKTAWKTCLKELIWFIRGRTSNRLLTEQNVHIWDANSTREFLDSRNLQNYKENELGPIYGHQWRHFNAEWKGDDANYEGSGIDQLQEIINNLKDKSKRSSRRLVMSAWNPCQLDEMALPPCHVLCQFYVHDGNKLSCSMYQRSVDIICGQPFNIASYSFLTHLIAHHCDLIPHEFVYFMGDCHIYEEHLDAAQIQLLCSPYPFPTLDILSKNDNINDYNIDDFKINDYIHHPPIKVKMVA